jgi:hypothetical protein
MMLQGIPAMIALNAESSLRLEHAGVLEIQCVSGVLWITREGDVCDRFLGPGDTLRPGARGVTLATALEPSLVRLLERPLPRWHFAWPRWLRRWPLVRAPICLTQPNL